MFYHFFLFIFSFRFHFVFSIPLPKTFHSLPVRKTDSTIVVDAPKYVTRVCYVLCIVLVG